MANIKVYPNGLRLVVEPMANFKSVAFSVMVMAGSGDETPTEQGLSHFCEHMLFKGTNRRTGQQIIDELSNLGVDYNAWTSESATCYHTKGVADNLEQCFDILSDMYFNLKFTEEDFQKEGDVIVQEIAMHNDNPQSVLYDQLNTAFFKGTKYEHPVAGYAPAIKKYQPADIYQYIKKHYTAPNTIIALAGNVTQKQAEELVKKYFLTNYANGKALPKARENVPAICPATFTIQKKKDTEQQHVAVSFPVCNQFDDDRFALALLSAIFGGDMSSRLFINVREKLGLVYSIHSMVELSDIGGYFAVVFSCTPKNTNQVLEVINNEIKNLRDDGVTEAELGKVKNLFQVKRLFQSEHTVAVNDRNADSLSARGVIMTDAQYLAKINGLTVSDLNAVVKKYFEPARMATVIVGK